jgi:acyl transferase domain-containing protein
MYVRDEASNAPVLPVAIVGAALRFPGCRDPASYQEMTSTGRQLFRELARTAVDHSQAHAGGTGPVFSLDGVPLRAALLDGDGTGESRNARLAADEVTGSQVLAAQVAAAALADVPDAGRAPLPRTGAIIAGSTEPGTAGAGGWVCDSIGLPGATAEPSLSADYGVCSLAAVAAACEVLKTGELDLVLAGGVSTGIDHAWLSHRGRAGKLAVGDVRIYDASPTGTLPGEGCGVVALMRAADARAAGLPVYAEIAGWHAAAGTDPGPAALWPAYLRAGIDPADVQFVEGHGAASAAEDLAELSALAEVFGSQVTGTSRRCALGAVTANLGDTRSAAGVAGLLKTALAMTAGVIPATAGCVRPHRLLQEPASPFRLPRAPEPWPETAARFAAVNSLGVDGPAGVPRSGPVHIVLRREQDAGSRAGRRRRTANMVHAVIPFAVPAPRAAAGDAPRIGAHVAPPRPRLPLDSRSPASRTALSRSQAETPARA